MTYISILPQSNGMAERFNGNIQKIWLKLTCAHDIKWSKYLSEALYAYQITAGPVGMSLYQAAYGRKHGYPQAALEMSEEVDRLQAI